VVTGDKEHFIMIKGSICQQDEIIINIHACKIHEAKPDRTDEKWGAPQYPWRLQYRPVSDKTLRRSTRNRRLEQHKPT